MQTTIVYEIIGYVASALIVLSLTMRSLVRLRVINLVGAAVFTAYGLLIEAPPVWVVNGAIVLIDVWELRRMFASGPEQLDVLEVDATSGYLRRLLERHAADIERFMPGFDGVRGGHRGWLVLRDDAVAAVVVARRTAGDEWLIGLDYALPAYRDHTSGRFVYDRAEIWRDLGATSVVSDPGSDDHRRYLQRMGFEPAGELLRRAV